MKKIVILVILLSSYLVAQQGIMKGSYTFGGNIGFSSYSQDGSSDSQTNFYFMPNAGYFFIDQLYTGIQIEYSHSSYGDNSTNSIGFGPEVRYYLLLDILSPFLGVRYSYIKTIAGQDNYDLEYTNTEFTLSGGVDYFVTDYFAFEAVLNYSFINLEASYNESSADADANEFNINFGAKYFIF